MQQDLESKVAFITGGSGLFTDQSRLQAVLDRTPMARLASPESVADAVAFLASPRADLITGVTLPVDCGWTAW
jgi:NAD(P)-dependent dehydrogenase (short-subunit alcohol dehydrogenase family)